MALILILISLSLCYFSPGEVFPSLAPYHIQQVLILSAVAVSLPSFIMRGGKLPKPHYILMLGLWVAVVLSLLSHLIIRGSFEAFLDFGVIAIIYFLVLLNAFTPSRIRIICLTIVLCAAIMSVQGILAYHTGYLGDQLLHISEEGDTVTKRVRAFGILNDANDFAQFLLVALSMLGMLWKRKHYLANFAIMTPLAGLFVYTIFLTGSRGAMFGLAVIVFVLALSRVGKVQAAILAAAMFALMIFGHFGAGRDISVSEGSAAGRVMAWGAGISFLRTSPLFGIGFEQFTEVNELTAHNSFVLAFAELGFFGYFFWLALVVTSILGLQRLSKLTLKTPSDIELRRCVTTLRTAFYCFMATSWFLSRTYNLTLYLLLALSAGLIQYERNLNPDAGVPTKRWVAVTVASQLASIILIYATVRVRSL